MRKVQIKLGGGFTSQDMNLSRNSSQIHTVTKGKMWPIDGDPNWRLHGNFTLENLVLPKGFCLYQDFFEVTFDFQLKPDLEDKNLSKAISNLSEEELVKLKEWLK